MKFKHAVVTAIIITSGASVFASDLGKMAFDFIAPSISNEQDAPNQTGSIVYNDNENLFYGNHSGTWSPLSQQISSGGTGRYSMQSAKVTTNGTTSCTVALETGDWITSTTANGVGDCTLTMTGFTAQPACSFSVQSNGLVDVNVLVDSNTAPTNTTLRLQIVQDSAANDGVVFVKCFGPAA